MLGAIDFEGASCTSGSDPVTQGKPQWDATGHLW